jgi:hypothetical protein
VESHLGSHEYPPAGRTTSTLEDLLIRIMNSFQYKPPSNNPISSEDLLADVRSVAKELGRQKLSMRLYVELGGKYNPSTILRRFGTWNRALSRAGLRGGNIINYSEEELFENILIVWQHRGKQPTLSSRRSLIR